MLIPLIKELVLGHAVEALHMRVSSGGIDYASQPASHSSVTRVSTARVPLDIVSIIEQDRAFLREPVRPCYYVLIIKAWQSLREFQHFQDQTPDILPHLHHIQDKLYSQAIPSQDEAYLPNLLSRSSRRGHLDGASW